MRLTIRVLGLTGIKDGVLVVDIVDQDDEGPAVTTQAEPWFGFIPGALEYDKPQP